MITVKRWHVNTAMPPDETKFAPGCAEEAIDYARRISRERINYAQVVDEHGMEYARFTGTWIYEPVVTSDRDEPPR